MEKKFGNKNTEDVRKSTSDVQVIGNPDTVQLICKASSEGEKWMKSTKALNVPGLGVVVQFSTQVGNNIAESSCFVPGATIEKEFLDDMSGTVRNKIVRAK